MSENPPQPSPTPFVVSREPLSAAIIELNSMSPCEGIIMSRDGFVKVGDSSDPDFFCMLLPAPTLARALTAAGLSSYTGKELREWASAYPLEPLQAIVDSARS